MYEGITILQLFPLSHLYHTKMMHRSLRMPVNKMQEVTFIKDFKHLENIQIEMGPRKVG